MSRRGSRDHRRQKTRGKLFEAGGSVHIGDEIAAPPSITQEGWLATTIVSSNAPSSKGGTFMDRRGSGGALAGVVWFIGWLFSIGYLHLVWWKIILGIVVWPLFLGQKLG